MILTQSVYSVIFSKFFIAEINVEDFLDKYLQIIYMYLVWEFHEMHTFISWNENFIYSNYIEIIKDLLNK